MSDELYIKLVVTILEVVEILQDTEILQNAEMGVLLVKTEKKNKVGDRALSEMNFLTPLKSMLAHTL